MDIIPIKSIRKIYYTNEHIFFLISDLFFVNIKKTYFGWQQIQFVCMHVCMQYR